MRPVYCCCLITATVGSFYFDHLNSGYIGDFTRKMEDYY